MSYLEQAQGRPAGKYTDDLLAIDADSGPWLVESQRSSLVAKHSPPRFDVDLTEGVIWFGDDERRSLVARVHTVGSYSPEDDAWVWAWTNEKLAAASVLPKRAADEHPEVDEFKLSLIPADELKAWTLTAAVAYLMKAEACYRLPGEVQLFVALTDICEIAPDDPRAIRHERDPEQAQAALAEFAGQGAVRIGAALVAALQEETALDPVIEVLYRFAEQLEALGHSPVGEDTPAAAAAAEIAAAVRAATLELSLPPGHPGLATAAQQVLGVLEGIASRFGAWPDDPS